MQSTPKTMQNEQIVEIYADLIIEPIEAMRTDFDDESLRELANNIKQNGLISPILLRPVGDKFEIVAGHRRFKAMCMIPWSKIPAIVRTMSGPEMFARRAAENLFREDVNPVDEAIFIGKLIGQNDSKIPEIAKLVDRSEQWVKDRLDILLYPDYFLAPIKAGQIKLGTARALAKIEDEHYRRMFFDNALRDGMAVWTAEYYFSQWQAGIFKAGEEIIAPLSIYNPNARAIIRQKCEKCGGVAEAPNLTNVFIHIECPAGDKSP